MHAHQALVERSYQIFPGTPVAIRARPHVVTCLCRDEQLITVGTEREVHHAPEGLFGGTVGGAIVIGEVVAGDAVVEGIVHHGFTIGKVGGAAEVVPEAERQCGHEDAGASAATILHQSVVAVGIGGVDGVDHGCRAAFAAV